MIERQLGSWGVQSKIVGPRQDALNLIATAEGNGPGPHLVFNGHMDVFPAGERSQWERNPFGGNVVNSRIYGRGSGDMKGGLTASLWAFAALASLRREWPGRITFTAVSEEETFGPAGARYLVEQHPDEVLGDAMIDGEPSSVQLMNCGSKGVLWLRLKVHTEGGHSAKPHIGRSAIKEMLALLAHLEQRIEDLPCPVPPEVRAVVVAAQSITDAHAGAGASDNLLRLTTNIGVLNGGLKVNMKAESCVAELDVRLPPGVEVALLLGLVEDVVKQHNGASFEVMNEFAPSFCDPSALIFSAVAKATAEVTGTTPAITLSLATGDHRLWRWAGVPAVTFGPRIYNGASANEYITVADLLAVAKIHAIAGASFLTGQAQRMASSTPK